MAAAAGFDADYIAGGDFQLRSYFKVRSHVEGNNAERVLRVYLEGDGKAWSTRYRPSINPTPWQPLALELATLDNTATDILYLGRPCHYRPTLSDQTCDPVFWTLQRYSQTVVGSLSEALSQFKQQHDIKKIELVGFSGGGTLALLLAAQREDVIALRTVAGNLDVKAFERHHKISPMRGSLNPVDYAGDLAAIPQLHFSGAEDKAVPSSIAQHYLSRFAGNDCVQFRVVAGVGHHDGWSARWQQLLTESPVGCGGK